MSKKNELESYEALVDENDRVKNIMTPDMAKYMFGSNKLTVNSLGSLWSQNLRENIELYKKHGSFIDSFHGYGIGKAVISVGAGPSFNINKDVLLQVYQNNILFDDDKQPFIIISTNKQFKPLLDMGIYPHFVAIMDAGEALYPQLCEDIPDWAKSSILIAGLHTSPKIIKQWDKQGGHICFYLVGEDEDKKFFEKETGEDAERVFIEQGANIQNTLWMISNSILGSTVHILMGADLSFPYSKSLEERRKSFYADGDYSLNLANKHDDAKEEFGWMGFTNVHFSEFDRKQLVYDLQVVGVSRLFWIYKVWLETQVAIWYEKQSFQVFNCSEQGILGVLCRDFNSEKDFLKDKSSWYLMDELCPKAWRTRTLADGVREFLEARFWVEQNKKQETRTGAESVIVRPDQMSIVKRIVQNEKERLTHFGLTSLNRNGDLIL